MAPGVRRPAGRGDREGWLRPWRAYRKGQLFQAERLTRFTGWLFEQVEPFLEGTVWEAGCGTQTYTEHMVAAGCRRILATDRDEALLEVARRRFEATDRVSVFNLDMSREEEFQKVRGEHVQTIVCLNVLEHIEDDGMFLRNMRGLLPPKGRLVLLVPAHPSLFSGIDASVHHRRRYTARELLAKLRTAGFRVVKLYYFNALGILGWFFYGHILRRRTVPETPAAPFDRLIPILRGTERAVLRGRLGVSLIGGVRSLGAAPGFAGHPAGVGHFVPSAFPRLAPRWQRA